MSQVSTSMYQRIKMMADDRRDLMTFEDGYIYIVPGYRHISPLFAQELRILADILDTRNEDWDEQVRNGDEIVYSPSSKNISNPTDVRLGGHRSGKGRVGGVRVVESGDVRQS